MPEHPDNELGRRLLAAVLSYRMGRTSVDWTLEHEIPEVVNNCWSELGQRLLALALVEGGTHGPRV
jgi:hypothetical protein